MPKITFIESGGVKRSYGVQDGDTILDVAHRHNVNLEGACEGEMACSTCHIIVDGDWFSRLDAASEEEEDMLDLAADLRPTSRLGCQIILTDLLDGLVVSLPTDCHNILSD